MIDGHNGWVRLAVLWMLSFVDNVLNTPIQTWVSIAVLILTVLQIFVTIKKLRQRNIHDTVRGDL